MQVSLALFQSSVETPGGSQQLLELGRHSLIRGLHRLHRGAHAEPINIYKDPGVSSFGRSQMMCWEGLEQPQHQCGLGGTSGGTWRPPGTQMLKPTQWQNQRLGRLPSEEGWPPWDL